MTTKREFRTVGGAMMAAARKTGRASLRGIVGGATMAAALVLGMTACSSEDNMAGEPTTTEPTAQTQATIHVTVGAGISDGEAATRSLVVKDGTKRWLTFTLPEGTKGQPGYSPGDRLYIWGRIESDVRTMGGLLTITDTSADGKSATFEGDLTVWVNDGGDWKEDNSYSKSGDPMTWYGENDIEGWLIPAAKDTEDDIYTFYDDGTFNFNHDRSLVTGDGDLANKAMESVIEVKGDYNKSEGCFNLECIDAILNCTFSGLEANTPYYVRCGHAINEDVYNSQGLRNSYTYEQTVTTDAGGTARFAICTNINGSGYHGIQLNTSVDFDNDKTNIRTCILGQRTHLDAKVYNVSRKWTGSAFVKYVNLTGQTGDVTVKDGYTVEGTLSGHQLLIADGATVTLSGASVTAPEGRNYGAIRCLGDATIILVDGTTNTAQSGLYNYYAAVSVPEGKTLTINGGSAGTGKLVANAFVSDEVQPRAGIGGQLGNWEHGGNLIIAGGDVEATGNDEGAGIGAAADTRFGTISISGGKVTAQGGKNGAGIGTGGGGSNTSTCAGISISGGEVTATGGNNGAGIGSGNGYSGINSCNDITISGGEVTATGGSDGAGIGSGYRGLCRDISISGGANYIYVHKYGNGRCIGKGESGKCGTVIIDGQTITDDMYDDAYNVEDFPSFPNFNLTLDVYCDYKTSQTWTLTKKAN